MKFKTLILLASILLSPALTQAQEGHPFDGTWRGRLEAAGESQAVLLIMDYDGNNIQGIINPGRNSVSFQSASLDAAIWMLQVEAQSSSGEAIFFEGTLKEVGAPYRYIEGTWTQGDTAYSFRVTRE